MARTDYPLLYQINPRIWLSELSEKLGVQPTLDDVPDDELDRIAQKGIEWVWLLSVWQTGQAGMRMSRENLEWRKEFEDTLPDLREDDIVGSGFAITGYTVHQALGGDASLARLRERLRNRGLRLMLDFIPNHTALDHPWVEDHYDYYVGGTKADLARAPQDYSRANRKAGEMILAHGRDPYFPGWADTFQLNYGNPATQEAMLSELLGAAEKCDGVRCDMAMLILPEVFKRTWGIEAAPFWRNAIERVRESHREFCFLAEVYWDLEWTLQQQGFDFTYDKRLYDRLREGKARPVREHLSAPLDYQNKMARFLENHDEMRAASAFSSEAHPAAAAITYLSPGLRFFHQGQFEGRRERTSPHLRRAPKENVDERLLCYYDRLLTVLKRPAFRNGRWQLLDCEPAWEGNWTWDCFVAFAWQGQDGDRLVVAVNYAGNQSQCFVRLPFAELAGGRWRFEDLLGDAVYDRDGDDLIGRRLYLDEPPWKAMAFSIVKS